VPTQSENSMKYISGLGMVPVLKSLGAGLNGVEIGVCRGDNMKYLLENCGNISHITGIDPYAEYPAMTQEALNGYLIEAMQNLKKLMQDGRASVLLDRSSSAAKRFSKNSIDFVYIDGNHEKDSVFEDLSLWYDAVKDGGIISGHDYSYGSVTLALKEFMSLAKISPKINLVDNNSWWWRKNGL